MFNENTLSYHGKKYLFGVRLYSLLIKNKISFSSSNIVPRKSLKIYYKIEYEEQIFNLIKQLNTEIEMRLFKLSQIN